MGVLKEALQEKVAHGGGGRDSEQGTHKCEMNSGEGNGKLLLDSNSCLENPLLDLRESEQARRNTTTTTTAAMKYKLQRVGNS